MLASVFSDFGDAFSDPAPWYFRTLETWTKLMRDSGLRLIDVREPLHPTSNKPASVIFTQSSLETVSASVPKAQTRRSIRQGRAQQSDGAAGLLPWIGKWALSDYAPIVA